MTYPHDLILSRNASALLRCVMMKTDERAKSLILLGCSDCRETVQAGEKRDRTSLSGRAAGVAHKVVHRHSGENQKHQKIKNLPGVCEIRLKFVRVRAFGGRGDV